MYLYTIYIQYIYNIYTLRIIYMQYIIYEVANIYATQSLCGSRAYKVTEEKPMYRVLRRHLTKTLVYYFHMRIARLSQHFQ